MGGLPTVEFLRWREQLAFQSLTVRHQSWAPSTSPSPLPEVPPPDALTLCTGHQPLDGGVADTVLCGCGLLSREGWPGVGGAAQFWPHGPPRGVTGVAQAGPLCPRPPAEWKPPSSHSASRGYPCATHGSRHPSPVLQGELRPPESALLFQDVDSAGRPSPGPQALRV